MLRDITIENYRLFENFHFEAFIHTWLAWQDLPGRPMGQAITAHALRHDHELSRRFVTWLNELFL